MGRRVSLRILSASWAFLFFYAPIPEKHSTAAPIPDQFIIAQHTFFDFGPPTDFYELFVARAIGSGTSIERVSVTPPADVCYAPAKTEVVSAMSSETPAELLDSTNPCSIPEKDLRRKLQSCKNCLVFSGAKVVMQVRCGTQTRLIRSDILDRDMFGANPNTREHTSWTIRLLQRLDSAVGPSVVEKQQILTIPGGDEPSTSNSESETLQDLGAGKYDALFQDAPDKASDLYRASQIPPSVPTIQLIRSVPLQPEVSAQPIYPPLARMARIEGALYFTLTIDSTGGATNLSFESGHPLLRGAVAEAVSKWKFSGGSVGQQIEAAIQFSLNCPTPSRPANSR
jgi:TonB-like protein